MMTFIASGRAAAQRGWGVVTVFVLAVLAAGLLAACSVNEVRPGEPLRADTDHGLVVLSLTHSGQRGFDLLFKIDGPNGSVSDRFVRLYAYGSTRDWNGVERRGPTPPEAPDGRLLVLQLEPGTYRIDHWKGRTDYGGFYGEGFEVYSEPVSVSFIARAGEVVYAGNVHIALPTQLNYLANLSHNTYRIDTGDMRARDLALLREKFPQADLGAISTALVEFPQSGQPLRYYIFNFRSGDEQVLVF